MLNAGSQKLAAFRRSGHDRFPGGADLPRNRPIPQQRIAAAIGVGKAFVSSLESGSKCPGLRVATRMKDLGIADPEDWLRPAMGDAA